MVTKELPGQQLPGQQMGARPDRIYAVGDVHGHATRLRAMHDAIRRDLRDNPAGSVTLVHLGDYIDRGPDSAACLALLAASDPIEGVPTVNLMGNHERMMLDALEWPGQGRLWLENGGDAALRSWGIDPQTQPEQWRARIPANHLHFLETLVLTHVAGDFLFVHAGVQPGIRLEKQSPLDLLWIRAGFLDWDGIMLPEAPHRVIVHGHTPASQPEVRRNRIGIDTNAARGGKLTCAALSGDSVYFLQV